MDNQGKKYRFLFLRAIEEEFVRKKVVLNPPEVKTKGRKAQIRLKSVLVLKIPNLSQEANLKRQALGPIKLINPVKKLKYSH